MSIGDVGRVPLEQPIDLSQVTQPELEQAADNLIATGETTLTKDQIVNYLQDLKNQGIHLEQKHIDSINADNPELPRPNPVTISFQKIRSSMSNPFLAANPYATFVLVFFELSFKLSQIKIEESEIGAETIMHMAALAKETADMIKAAGEKEAIMHFVSAGVAAAQAAVQLYGARKALKMDESSRVAAMQMKYQGVSSLVGAFDSLSKGILTLQKSAIEGRQKISEKAMEIISRVLHIVEEAIKAADDMNPNQFLQQVLSQAAKAHGFNIR